MRQFPGAIKQVLQAAADPQYDFERQLLVNRARRNWQYVIGNQFLVPGLVTTPYGEIADYLMMDAPSISDETGADMKFCYAVNVIGGDLNKFIAVMGNSAPRVKAVADDPTASDQLENAHDADAMLRDLWNKWHADDQQRTMAFHQYTTGPCYLRSSWVNDARKYGQEVVPKMDTEDQAQPDGTTIPVPIPGEPQVYVNGDAELRIYSVLEVTHPFMAEKLEDCHFLRIEVMRSKWDLLAAYGGPLEEYRTGEPPDDEMNAASAAAAEARESTANPSGMGRQRRPDQWRFHEHWLQPMLFEAITDPRQREIFYKHFTDGLYIAKVGNINVDCDNRAAVREISVCKTGRGTRILERPIADDAVPIQRAINDLANMAIETILRAITKTIADSTLLNREAIRNNEAIPAEIILTAMPVDGDLSKRIYQIPPTRLSDQLVPFIMQLRAFMQDITGMRPELSGGGAPTQTYREAKQRKDQALMQLSPQAAALQAAWCRAGENGVKMRAKYGTGQIKSPRKSAFGIETDVVDLANLKEDGWHVEADDSFPMTASDRFDKLYGLLKEFPPEVQQALSILDSMNLEETLEILQIPGYESVPEDQKRKTLADIAELLQGQPIQGEDGSMQPSVPMDEWDDHQFVADFIPKWMKSKTGQRWEQQSPAGFQNVVAFWQAHQQAAQPPAPPPPPPVRPSLSVSAKLEDMPPAFTQEILQGAGLPANPESQPQPLPPAPAEQGPGPASPGPTGEEAQAEPELPPLSDIPQGPQPISVQ